MHRSNPQPLSLALLLLAPLIALAQEAAPAEQPAPRPYKALGAPTRPKVAVHWNRYHDFAEATKILKDLAAAHPQRAKLESLGKSYGEREMWVLTVTEPGERQADEKPAMWIDGGIHANEIQATEVVLYTAWWLLEMADEHPEAARLLRERTFYLMPMMSPDSRDAHMHRPNSTHTPRTGQRPVDDDRDGLVDEDRPNDLDGDGHITQMRVRDPNGTHVPHPDFPELMIPAKEGQKGEFRLLGTEGYDADADGAVNEDSDGFYDPNRDWGWNWQPKYVQSGAHRYPFSILENRMVAEFITARPNIAAAQSYHNTGGMILRGPGDKADRFEAADVKVLDLLGKRGETMLPGYKYLNIANDLYEVFGGELDWLYANRGVAAFTNELFTGFNLYRKASEGFFPPAEELHRFNRDFLLGEGLVPWREVEHPQFGKIEVGGLKKNWSRQPPSFLLEEECHRNMAFTLYHADQMPQVAVQSVTARKLSDGLFEVTAIVENPKVIPTRLAIDVARGITPPDKVRLELDAGKIATAFVGSDPFFRDAKEQRRNPHEVRVSTVPGRGVVYLRWLVTGDGPYRVSVASVKGGMAAGEAEKAE